MQKKKNWVRHELVHWDSGVSSENDENGENGKKFKNFNFSGVFAAVQARHDNCIKYRHL